MIAFTVWRYEIRRCGWSLLGTPAGATAGVLAVAVLASASGTPPARTGRLLLAATEAVLPLAAGVTAAAVVAREPAVELQLSLPTPYRTTLCRRLLVMSAWPALLATVLTAVMAGAGWWPSAHPLPSGVLVWLPPLLWLAALGAAVAVGSRSVGAASAAVAGIWLAEQLFTGVFADSGWLRTLYLFPASRLPGADGWAAGRVLLLVTAGVLCAAVWLLLARPDRMLTDEHA